MKALGVAIVLASAAPVYAAGPPPVQVQVQEYGTYRVEGEEVSTDPVYAYTGVSPMRVVHGVQWTAKTDRIDGRVCERFGIVYAAPEMRPGASLPVTVRVRHPMMVRPDGQQAEVESWHARLSREGHMSGFDFYEPWEVVLGTWTIEVVYQDQILASKQFEVVPPRPGLPPLEGCGVPVS